MANPIANESEFLSCLTSAAAQTVKPVTSSDLQKLKVLAQNHKAYLKTFSVPDKYNFSNALIHTAALQKIIKNVNLVRIYIGLDFSSGNPDYTFIITQCDDNGNDLIIRVAGVDPVYHEFCCKCPPDTCPGAELLKP